MKFQERYSIERMAEQEFNGELIWLPDNRVIGSGIRQKDSAKFNLILGLDLKNSTILQQRTASHPRKKDRLELWEFNIKDELYPIVYNFYPHVDKREYSGRAIYMNYQGDINHYQELFPEIFAGKGKILDKEEYYEKMSQIPLKRIKKVCGLNPNEIWHLVEFGYSVSPVLLSRKK